MTVEGVYPNANAAMSELSPVLKPDGQPRMIALGNPHDNYGVGKALVAIGRRFGDLVRDMNPIFRAFGLQVSDQEIGEFGSIHLYLATKRA